MGDDLRPPRGYSWPPFEPGNTASLRHGADSPRVISPLAREFRNALPRLAPWTSAAPYRLTVEAWAQAEARCFVVRHWLDAIGLLDGHGKPRPAAVYLERLEGRAQALRSELGLSPLAHVKLMAAMADVADVTPGLHDAFEALKAEGAKLLAARDVDADGEPPQNAEKARTSPDAVIDAEEASFP